MGDLFVQKSASALIRHGGDIAEDYLRELNGYSATQLYKEMGNNPVIAATLSAIKMTLRRVKWFASAENDKQDDEAKDYLESCIHDMSVSFSDHIDQALSMMQYGFAPFEVVLSCAGDLGCDRGRARRVRAHRRATCVGPGFARVRRAAGKRRRRRPHVVPAQYECEVSPCAADRAVGGTGGTAALRQPLDAGAGCVNVR